MVSIGQLEPIFLLEEIGETIRLDSSQLVRAVRNYPIIYDHTLRRDQALIFNAWENICASMLPKFHSMTLDEQIASRKRLKDRWSYMRATYRRDVFNNRVDAHRHLGWIKEMDFLHPILYGPPKGVNRKPALRGKTSSSSQKKKPQNKATSTATTSVQLFNDDITYNPNLFVPIPAAFETSSTTEITTTPTPSTTTTLTSISNATISSVESSDSDKSIMDISSTATDSSIDENKIRNELLVDTFMSTFSLDTFFTSTIDPDQIFLLTLLQSYRLVQGDKRKALQRKFYTFLRE